MAQRIRWYGHVLRREENTNKQNHGMGIYNRKTDEQIETTSGK